ncbi:MAG: hypothetical protein ACRDGP_04380 [Actinomycetota bacterium]
MVIYAIPLVILTGVGALGIRSIGRSHPVLGYTAATIVGVLLGLGWTYAVAFALGGWFLAIGVPPLPVWVAAAVAGLTAGVPARSWAMSLGLPVASAVLSAALLSGALLALQEARQDPGFVAVFRADVTTDQTNEVWEEVLGTPTDRGTELLPGIRALRATSYDGRYAIAIEFWPDATDAEIERVRDALEESPHIDKVVVDEG